MFWESQRKVKRSDSIRRQAVSLSGFYGIILASSLLEVFEEQTFDTAVSEDYTHAVVSSYTIRNRTNPNTQAKQNILLPEILFLPSRLLWC